MSCLPTRKRRCNPATGIGRPCKKRGFRVRAWRLRANGAAAPLSPVRRLIEAFAATAEPVPGLRARLAVLSPREIEVLRLIAHGRSNREIVDALVLSPATVESHVHALLGKLDLRDRVQAVVLAYESGLAKPGGR